MFRLSKSIALSLFFCFLIFLCAHKDVAAQGLPGITEPVTVQMYPELPKPGQTVNFQVQSYSTDLNRADFTWSIDGKTFKTGPGITQISFTAERNKSTTVTVVVKTLDIGTLSKSFSFTPADVTLLWQSDGYVPPFYQGKSLELYGSSFKVTAIPEFFTSAGKRIDPKTLIYTWKKNGTVDAAQSGYGKDTFTGSQSSYLRGGDTISVETSTVTRDIGANDTVTISPVIAEALFYENSPLYGIVYEKALGERLNLSSEEITLRAEPFYISTTDPQGSALTLDWTINNQAIPLFKNKNEITLRKTGTAGGQSNIDLIIQHQTNVLQGAKLDIAISQ